MKILMISTDRKILEESSAVAQRMIEYGRLVDELHIVVFNLDKQQTTNNKQLSNNVYLYTTNSKRKLNYIFDAIRIGKKVASIGWLVTTQDPFETGFVGWRIARSVKARLQLQVHTDFLSPYFVQGSTLNKIRVRLARFLLPRADSVRTVSKRIRNSIANAGIKLKYEPKILPIFVDVQKIKNTEPQIDLHQKYPQFKNVILMASRLSPEKNISLALQAFSKIVVQHPETGLIIVGEGTEGKPLKLKTKDYGIETNIIFEQWSDDLISYYKTADLFLNTSNYEGYGLTIVEAAAAGCPIVTTEVGVVGDMISEENALVCAVSDTQCIAQKIKLAIENKPLRQELAKKASQAINEMPVKTNKQYLEEYKKNWERTI